MIVFSLPLFQGEGWGGVRLLSFEAKPERPPPSPLAGGGVIVFSLPFFQGEGWGWVRLFGFEAKPEHPLPASPLAGGGVIVFKGRGGIKLLSFAQEFA